MTPIVQSDTELVERSIEGDTEAFGDLYQRYLSRIYRYIYYRVGEEREAEDLTETVFLKVWEAMPRFRVGEVSFKTWIYRVAHNLLVDHYRTRKEPPLTMDLDLEDPKPLPEEEVMRQEKQEWISAAIAQLNPDYQQILALRFINGLSHAEASEVVGRSVAAVRVMQHRALKALAKQLRGGKGEGND